MISTICNTIGNAFNRGYETIANTVSPVVPSIERAANRAFSSLRIAYLDLSEWANTQPILKMQSFFFFGAFFQCGFNQTILKICSEMEKIISQEILQNQCHQLNREHFPNIYRNNRQRVIEMNTLQSVASAFFYSGCLRVVEKGAVAEFPRFERLIRTVSTALEISVFLGTKPLANVSSLFLSIFSILESYREGAENLCSIGVGSLLMGSIVLLVQSLAIYHFYRKVLALLLLSGPQLTREMENLDHLFEGNRPHFQPPRRMTLQAVVKRDKPRYLQDAKAG